LGLGIKVKGSGLGFRVHGLGCRVLGLGLGFGVQERFGVMGYGFRV
jgi:hypothetical protein